MARQRVQTQYAANQVRLNPQASPVDTYVQPARNDQISRALEAVTGNVSRKNAKDARTKKESQATQFAIQKLQVAEAAFADGTLASWAKSKGNYSLADDPTYGPLLEIIHNQKIGAEIGLDVQTALYKWDSENSHIRDSDPEAYNAALDAQTRVLLKEHLGPESADAVGYASSMRGQINAATNQLKSQQFSEYRATQAALPLDNYLAQLGAAVNVAEIESTDTPDQRLFNIGEAVKASVSTAIQNGMLPPKEINGATTGYLIALAEETKDLSILDIPKNISTGNGGFLWGIKSENVRLVKAKRAIAAQLENDENNAYIKKQRAHQKASKDYQEAAFQYYGIHGDFEAFEGTTSSQQLGLYDINKIQKRITEFKETPLLTQADYMTYYEQFSSVTELTTDRAREMLEKMSIGSMGEWRLAESAMADVLQKRTSVYSSDPYKAASSFINHKYKIDPQSSLSLASVSTVSLDEYNKTQAQLKRRATSYIVDQKVLDRDLKAIGADEALQGTSLHMLSEEVKYDLFMKAANDSYSATATTLTGKLGGEATLSTTNVPNSGTTLNVNGVTVTVNQQTEAR